MRSSLAEILHRWDIAEPDQLLEPGSAAQFLRPVPLREAQAWCEVRGRFTEESRIWIPTDPPPTRPGQHTRLIGGKEPQDCELVMLKPGARTVIRSAATRCRIFVGRYGYGFSALVNLLREATLLIGDGATSNGVRIIVDEAVLRIGRDCMISEQVILQSNDQHGMVDVATGALLNEGPARLTIDEHVWLGRRSMVLPNIRIGAGSIVGAGSVVTKDVEANTVVAGIPARVVRSGTTWSRDPRMVDAAAQDYLARLHAVGE